MIPSFFSFCWTAPLTATRFRGVTGVQTCALPIWERDYVAKIQKQKRKAELNALQTQINPHFLYNTLNAITWQAADPVSYTHLV